MVFSKCYPNSCCFIHFKINCPSQYSNEWPYLISFLNKDDFEIESQKQGKFISYHFLVLPKWYFVSVSHFRIFASFDSLYRGSIWLLNINKSYLETESGLLSNYFTISKVQLWNLGFICFQIIWEWCCVCGGGGGGGRGGVGLRGRENQIDITSINDEK